MKWKELTKIAVSGSRRFINPDLVTQYIDWYIRHRIKKGEFKSTEDVVLITGGAIGVDYAVETYCRRNGIKNLQICARWLEMEKRAGPHRNQHIIDLANEALIFWDGESKGTKNALIKAKKKGIPWKIFEIAALRRILHIQPPVKIRIPSKNKIKSGKRIRQLVEDADVGAYFRELRKHKKEG